MPARADELREDLTSLLAEQMASLKRQTFGGVDKKEFENQVDRLKRIRELPANYIAAMQKDEA